jgi:hypothetical protein
MKIFGILLIVLGIIGILYGGLRVAYPDRVVDAGPLHVSVTKHKELPIPPIAGAVAVASGLALMFAGRRS